MNKLISRARPAVLLGAVAAALLTTAGAAEARTPIRDCGDAAGGIPYAITAQGVTCTTARTVAKLVTAKRACRPQAKFGFGFCTVRGYSCGIGQAGKELFLAHCERGGQTRIIRFEYGS